ncbi:MULTISPECIES: GntR family transcriptional regulator [unclassified Clostridioides]|uniref:GntR family transcriptional regulator n=1 Tax=unclassified Clostridioides TaxID=2635829 RepID=UPI001D0C826F|nr:GntR family transcriptional regulator [Clostridioides sp. ES-S-0001-02]MCC0640082.1 GntR family transcriptional regulator [Clostridioides sp. ES-S-0049-03]MCC0650018.1 GntR family transcriptional regulator [Clostridioides sp. ZZV15-6598]MCC0652143.1 GntR family transcriptional regulator [Clostridioides sp. ES-S-0001-03]MCC0655520.1 GntR family transcriptional regulator [Clostridioides sp. ES-S-0123-01]MCC0670638.1 GntR family transcriptional regulator [Clostridioides sp. ES-S-0145-01]MCC06
MEWELDNNKPIYIQLVEHLKLKIVSGEIKIGSKLETVRALAEDAEVNPNTMQKALTELERQGLVYSQRTKGRFVTDDKEKIKAMKEEIANVEINTLKETLVKLGYDEDEMLKLITENLKGEL